MRWALPPWLGSLTVRIVVLQLFALIVTVAGVLLAIDVLLGDIFVSFERRVLHDRAIVIARSVEPGPAGLYLRLPAPVALLYAERSGGFSYDVVDAQGHTIASSSGEFHAAVAKVPLALHPTYAQHVSGASGYFIGAFPGRAGGQLYWVRLVQDLSHPDVYADDILRVFLGRIVWFIPPITLAMLAVNGLIVQRTLRSVVIASRRAKAIQPHRIDVRLPEPGMPREIAPLVTAVNRAFDRLAEGFRRQREFTADVAHELRTPLAVLRLRADKIDDQALANAFRSDIDAMSHLADQLLALAELEAFTLPPDARADLSRVALEVVELLAPAALSAGLEIELVAPEAPVPVHGHASTLFRALRNLVENALAHSPPGGLVTVTVDDGGMIRVADRGPGITEANRRRIFERGWRRDRHMAGHGLGLSIVERIVTAHDGAIDVGETQGGGATFMMRFSLWSAENAHERGGDAAAMR